MKTRTFGLVALLAAGVLTLAGCGNNQTPVENPDENAEIANPASVYCEENWGTLNLEEGLCIFDDGSYCEEWAYYRGECQPGEIIYNTVSDEENAEEEVNEEENTEEPTVEEVVAEEVTEEAVAEEPVVEEVAE